MTERGLKDKVNLLQLENENLKKEILNLRETLYAKGKRETGAPGQSRRAGEQEPSSLSEEAIHRLIPGVMNEAVFTLDARGTILFCNRKFSEFLNQPPDKLTGADIFNYIPEQQHDRFRYLINQGLVSKGSGEIVFIPSSPGVQILFRLDIYPLPSSLNGGVCVVCTDITLLRKTEEELFLAKSELEQRINQRTEELKSINKELNSARVAALNMMQDAVEAKSIAEKLNSDLMNEIAGRKQFEQALSQSEERFRHLFEENLAIMYMSDAKTGRILDVNNAAVAYYGWSKEEMLTKSIFDFNTLPAEQLKQEIEKAALSTQIHFEFQHRRADGTVRDVEVFSSRLKLKDEYFLHSIIIDITERKRIQQINTLQHSLAVAVVNSDSITELLDVILHELTGLIDIKNLYFATYNEETRMLRDIYSRDQMDTIEEWSAENSLTGLILNQKGPLLLHKEEILELMEKGSVELIGTLPEVWLGVPLISGESKKGAVVIQSYDDPEAINQTTIEMLEVIAHELVIFLDRKYAQELAFKLTKAIEQSPVSVIITDRLGNIEYTNRHFTITTGYTPEEVKGKNPRILSSGETTKEVYQELWTTILSGKDWHGEIHNKKKNGELFWENVVISPVVNTRGEIVNFFAIKEDITSQKAMLEELISAKDKAEQMSRLKSSFLANMSHELRTPLIAILGFSEILMDESKDEYDKEMSQLIHKGGIRLLETLNLILNLSAIEANKVDVKNEIVDSHIVLGEVIQLFGAMASKKDITLEKRLNAHYSMLLTDRQMFTQIFNNLLNNAIKFTNQGGVTISTKNAGSKIVISVVDTGIGISEADQQIIWEEFRQASEGYNRSFEGTGLGLTITRSFVNKLGGEISLESELYKGTTFTVTFPLWGEGAHQSILPNPDTEEHEPEPVIEPASVLPALLMVEDDDNAVNLVRMITRGIYTVDHARTSEDTLTAVREKKYDIILMDINLGRGGSGVVVTKQIRQIEEYKDTPIVALTAFALLGDREEFLSAGCTHYLSKPFNKKQLLALLKEISEKEL